MKKILLCILIYFTLIFLIPPGIILLRVDTPGQTGNFREMLTPKADSGDITVKSYIAKDGKVMEFPLEEYLIGVVAAEMPAAFPDEALKAQAVAARTYIISRMLADKGDVKEHMGAPICTDPAHCKAWKSREEAEKDWGEGSGQYYEKVKSAVDSTKNQIILYEEKPISAVYYAMSGGASENAADVWGGDVPYLQSVNSSFDGNAPGFNSEAVISHENFKKIILEENPSAVLGDDPSLWIGEIKVSEGGGVISALIGGQEFRGTRLRSLFSLRSHNFTFEVTDENIIFHVKGYGHGVGLSQWGCKFLAEEGKNYEEILKYYYTGVELGEL